MNSIFLACQQVSTDIAQTVPTEKHMVHDTIPFDSLTMTDGDRKNKSLYYFKDKRFSGLAVKYEQAADGTWSFLYRFENGIVQRMDVFGVNGYQHRFVEMKDGYPSHCVMFHRNGNKYIEEYYDKNNNKVGTWKRWHESGELDLEKNYN